MATAILVVDDEPIIRETLSEFLQQERFSVQSCGSGEEAIGLVSKTRFDIVLCDINLPGLDGLEVLDYILRVSPETFVMLITAHATVDTAVEAFQNGAHDYLMKPILLREVVGKIRRLLKHREIVQENQRLRRELNRDDTGSEIVLGTSSAMKAAMDLARKAAPTPTTVLISGESGTGKELFARAIHRFAQTAKPSGGRFITVNCSAIPHEQMELQLFGAQRTEDDTDRHEPGAFVLAGPGTVYLDEIGELSLATQARLLRALEKKAILPVGASEPVPVTARVVAATTRDLNAEVEAGRFRQDLLYRLNAVTLKLPPLRERREDISELVERLVGNHVRAIGKRITGASHAAMQRLMQHPWKGNVRELDNALQRAVILSDGPLIQVADLPTDLSTSDTDPFAIDDLNAAMARFEKLHIERMLRVAPDKREAARRLDIGLSSLYRKIEQYGLSGDEK